MAYNKYAKHKRPKEYTVGQEVVCCVSQIAFSGKVIGINYKDTKDEDDITSYEIQVDDKVATFLRNNYLSIFGQIFTSLWINETELVSLNDF